MFPSLPMAVERARGLDPLGSARRVAPPALKAVDLARGSSRIPRRPVRGQPLAGHHREGLESPCGATTSPSDPADRR